MKINNKNITSSFYQIYDGYIFLLEFSKFLLIVDKKNFLLSIFYKSSLQVLNFICMLLPLKIILFLSPNQSLNEKLITTFNTKENLIISLCLLFLFFLGTTKILTNLILKSAAEKVDKIVKISNKSIGDYRAQKIRNKIRTCSSCFSSIVLIFIFFVGISLVYRELAVITIISILLSASFLKATKNLSLENSHQQKKDSKSIINFHAELIFFASFSYVVISGLLKPQDVIFFNLVIGMLLTRQITGLVSQLGKSLITLNNKNNFIIELLDNNK